MAETLKPHTKTAMNERNTMETLLRLFMELDERMDNLRTYQASARSVSINTLLPARAVRISEAVSGNSLPK